jgi:cytochrome b561
LTAAGRRKPPMGSFAIKRRTPRFASRENSNAMHSGRSHVTRLLHIFLLLIVIHQLVGSQFMERPLPGEDPAWPFQFHAWIGVAGVAAIFLFWLWTLVRHRSETPVGRLVPWFSAAGYRNVLVDAQRIYQRLTGRRALEPDNADGAFASAVHGLGLLVASVMAASGAAYFFFFEGTSFGGIVLGLHKLFANFMWAYLIGHAGAALLHTLWGDDILSRMFWLKRKTSAIETS